MMSVAAVVFVIGRGLIAMLFVLAGITKIAAPRPFLAHMEEQHVPKLILPLVILLEIGCGGALLFGWNARIAATALSAFCVATAGVFHRDFSQRAERTLFFKDIALAGGLAALAAG
jgi:putative oxidoreductase